MSALIPFRYRELVQAVERHGAQVRIRLTPKRVVVEIHRERREPMRAEFRQTRLAEKVEGWLARFALPRLQWEREQPTPGVAQLTIDFSADARRLNRAMARAARNVRRIDRTRPPVDTGVLRRALRDSHFFDAAVLNGVHVGLHRPPARRDA